MTEETVLTAGIDEVGRGPLAGPVVAAAVVFERKATPGAPLADGESIEHFYDSKKLTARRREVLVEEILERASSWSVVALGPRTIDQLNILRATEAAMSRALALVEADRALVDGTIKLTTNLPFQPIIKGDLLHPEIGAASIVAKVWRDRLMNVYEELYPGYGFEKHKGYPTKTHRAALEQLGVSPIHRRTFRTVAALLPPAGEAQTSAERIPLPLTGAGDEFCLSSQEAGPEEYHALLAPPLAAEEYEAPESALRA